jgi:hypothetical protein
VNKESFLEVVRQQYSEKIHAAYVEHEHGLNGKVDFSALNARLTKLMGAAKVEGLSATEFEELAHETLPAEVARGIVLGAGKKAA